MQRIAKGDDVARAVAIVEAVAAGERAALRAAVVDTAEDLRDVAHLLGRPAGVDVRRRPLRHGGGGSPGRGRDRACTSCAACSPSRWSGARSSTSSRSTTDRRSPSPSSRRRRRISSSPQPLTEIRTPTADGKLCGTLFAHFSGFYRRSWRANDFLWGRLDAAMRITQMLVSTSAHAGAGEDRRGPAVDRPRARLVRARRRARRADRGGARRQGCAIRRPPRRPPPGRAARRPDRRRREAHARDRRAGRAVRGAPGGAAARRRRGQQGLRTGLLAPHARARRPRSRDPRGVLEAVERLRKKPQDTFPQRLGRVGDDEWSSDLGVRTGARAGLVGLALARHTGGKAATPLTPLRAVLLPMAGAVSGRDPQPRRGDRRVLGGGDVPRCPHRRHGRSTAGRPGHGRSAGADAGADRLAGGGGNGARARPQGADARGRPARVGGLRRAHDGALRRRGGGALAVVSGR